MRQFSSIAISACAVCVLATQALEAGNQRQTSPAAPVIYMNFMPPPATLKEFWDASVAVVHVVVKQTRMPERDPGASIRAPRAVRMQTLTVREVLKPDPASAIGNEVVVKQYGGTVIAGGREQATAYPMPVFRVGEEYVLFLERAGPSYSIVSADAGAFRVEPGNRSVRVPDKVRERMAAYRDRTHVSLSEFLASLRSFRPR